MAKKADSKPSADVSILSKKKVSSATQFLLRGLAISLPSVLTLVILIWIGRGVYEYVISPISTTVRYTIAVGIRKSESTEDLVVPKNFPSLKYVGHKYLITPEYQKQIDRNVVESGAKEIAVSLVDLQKVYIPIGVEESQRAVPYEDYALVARKVQRDDMPRSVIDLYMEVVTHSYFQGWFPLSAAAVVLTIVLLYFIGRLVTARLGLWVVRKFETAVLGRLPVVSNVYGSVKQVTDFLFTERSVSYNRVVAVEYPRRGAWSLGFVTSDSLLEITVAAGEPLLSVLMPTSPMPMTGFTISVPRSEVLDLNMTIDQAFQYCLSCGVLVPSQQNVTPELLKEELGKRLAGTHNQTFPVEGARSLNKPASNSSTGTTTESSASKPIEESPQPPTDGTRPSDVEPS